MVKHPIFVGNIYNEMPISRNINFMIDIFAMKCQCFRNIDMHTCCNVMLNIVFSLNNFFVEIPILRKYWLYNRHLWIQMPISQKYWHYVWNIYIEKSRQLWIYWRCIRTRFLANIDNILHWSSNIIEILALH